MNFKRASMPYGGTNNAIDIRGDSELLPATLLLTLDHPDNDYTKSRPKNVKKSDFLRDRKNSEGTFFKYCAIFCEARF